MRRALLLLMGAVGCDAASTARLAAPPRATVRDELRIGSIDDTSTAMTYVHALVPGPHGRMYSAHPIEARIRIHDPEGRPLRAMGRNGSGPGEFISPVHLGLLGDTLWVLDRADSRFTFFDLDGELLGVRTWPALRGDAARVATRPLGILSNGTYWGHSTPPRAAVIDGSITRARAVRLDSTGAEAGALIEYSVANSWWRLHDEKDPRTRPFWLEQPFSPADIVAIAEDRPEMVIVERPIATDPALGTFRVTKLDLDGDTLYSVSFAYQPEPIPEHVVDSVVRWIATPPPNMPPSMRATRPSVERGMEVAREALYLPAFLPPVELVVPGRDGATWLQRKSVGVEREWWILDRDGRLHAALTLPARVRVLAAERDRFWAEETGELDVPYIVRYAVEVP